MADKEKAPLSEEEQRVLTALTQVLWVEDMDDALPPAGDARKAAFKENKADYKQKARKMMRKLNARGIVLSLDREDA